VAVVKHDRGMRPNSAVPSRLTSRHACPICTTGPRAIQVASTPGLHPRHPPLVESASRVGGRPGQLLLIADPVGQAAVQDADQPVTQGA